VGLGFEGQKCSLMNLDRIRKVLREVYGSVRVAKPVKHP